MAGGHILECGTNPVHVRTGPWSTALSPPAKGWVNRLFRSYYDALRARGAGHNAALPQLANRLVGILHGCLKTGTAYNEHTDGITSSMPRLDTPSPWDV